MIMTTKTQIILFVSICIAMALGIIIGSQMQQQLNKNDLNLAELRYQKNVICIEGVKVFNQPMNPYTGEFIKHDILCYNITDYISLYDLEI